MKAETDTNNLPDGYAEWRRKIENLIEKTKLNAAIHVRPTQLSTYCVVNFNLRKSIRSA